MVSRRYTLWIELRHSFTWIRDGKLARQNTEAYLAFWWMGNFGSLTPKRHLAVSNAATVGRLELKNKVKALKSMRSHGAKSSATYHSKSGRPAFKGTPFLKSTGPETEIGCVLSNDP